MDIRRMGPGDEAALAQASPLFDGPVRSAAATRFLESETHHILLAYAGEIPAGFVSGVEVTHPDKGTEMFLYELAVDERFRGRGYGTALVKALAGIARERRCYGMWVLTDEDNHAALATYGAAGGRRESLSVMLSWQFDGIDVAVEEADAGDCRGTD